MPSIFPDLSWQFKALWVRDLHLTCKVCDKRLSSKKCLSIHEKNVHSLDTYTCTICSKPLKTKANLRVHMRHVHFTKKKDLLTCDICGAQLKHLNSLRSHIKIVHPKEEVLKDFACQICDRQLKRAQPRE